MAKLIPEDFPDLVEGYEEAKAEAEKMSQTEFNKVLLTSLIGAATTVGLSFFIGVIRRGK